MEFIKTNKYLFWNSICTYDDHCIYLRVDGAFSERGTKLFWHFLRNIYCGLDSTVFDLEGTSF